MAGDNRSIRLWVRAIVIAIFFLVLFYLGRPLYWKLSASIQEGGSSVVQDVKPINDKAQLVGPTLMPADTKHVGPAGKKPLLEKGEISSNEGKPIAKSDNKAGAASKSRRLLSRNPAQTKTWRR